MHVWPKPVSDSKFKFQVHSTDICNRRLAQTRRKATEWVAVFSWNQRSVRIWHVSLNRVCTAARSERLKVDVAQRQLLLLSFLWHWHLWWKSKNTEMTININYTNRMPKSWPFRWTPWDLSMEKIWMVTSGERKIIFLILFD